MLSVLLAMCTWSVDYKRIYVKKIRKKTCTTCMAVCILQGGFEREKQNREGPCTELNLFKERCEIPVRINYLSGEIEVI